MELAYLKRKKNNYIIKIMANKVYFIFSENSSEVSIKYAGPTCTPKGRTSHSNVQIW